MQIALIFTSENLVYDWSRVNRLILQANFQPSAGTAINHLIGPYSGGLTIRIVSILTFLFNVTFLLCAILEFHDSPMQVYSFFRVNSMPDDGASML